MATSWAKIAHDNLALDLQNSSSSQSSRFEIAVDIFYVKLALQCLLLMKYHILCVPRQNSVLHPMMSGRSFLGSDREE